MLLKYFYDQPLAHASYLVGCQLQLDKSKPVVAQCFAGTRSAIATSVLRRSGFDVTDLRGGYQAWVAAGLPVTVPKA